MQCKLPYNEKFYFLQKKYEDGNENLIIKIAWPKINTLGADTTSWGKLFQSLIILCKKKNFLVLLLNLLL